MVKVRIAIDFFIPDWRSADDELWMFLQPQIDRTGFAAYVGALDDPSAHQYEVAQNQGVASDPALWPVSVNLPTGLNIALQARHGAPLQDVWPASLENDRVAGAVLADPVSFRRANKDPDAPGEAAEFRALEIRGGASYATTYNQGMMQELAAAVGADQQGLLHFSELGLTGGVIRYLPPEAVIGLDRLHIMNVPSSTFPATNQHCLLGLGFKLGLKSDVAKLAGIRELTLTLTAGADVIQVLDLHGHPKGAASIATFFASLATFEPTAMVRTELTAGLWRRVYAHNADVALGRTGATSNMFAAPRGEAGKAPPPLKRSRLARLGARIARPIQTPRELLEIEDEVNAIGDLQWSPHLAIAGVLTPYRSAPVAEHAADRRTQVLRFVPDEASRRRLGGLDPLDASLAQSVLEIDKDSKTGRVLDLPEFLGAFNFPWDAANGQDRTILFYGSEEYAGRLATLFLPVLDAGAPLTFTTPIVGVDPKRDPFGPRWELLIGPATAWPDAPFDALLLKSAAAAKDILPIAYLTDAFNFVAAQSASRTEFVLGASYPKVADIDQGAGNDAQREFADDLINYNSVNYWLDDSWANPHSESYPQHQYDSREQVVGGETEPRRNHAFHVVTEHKTRFEHADPGLERNVPKPTPEELADAIRLHVWRVYDKLGGNFRVEADLEHTYGVSLGIEPRPALIAPRAADWPPAMAPRVTVKTGAIEDLLLTRFVSAAIDWAANGGRGKAMLTFEPSLLVGRMPARPGEIKGEEAGGPLIEAAWRSIAELAYASELSLVIACKRFNWNNRTDFTGIADAVTEVGTVETAIPGLSDAARLALSGAGLAEQFCVELPLFNGDPISRGAHLVTVSLKIVRVPGDYLQIPEPAVAQLLREPDLTTGEWFGPQGANIRAAPEALPACLAWLATLATDAAALQPSSIEAAEASAVRTFVGGTGAWIAPEGKAALRAGSIVPTLAPMGYRPIEKDPFFADASTRVLDRGLGVLSEAINCGVRGWTSWSAAEWKAHFTKVAAASDYIFGLAEGLANLIAPLPAPREAGSLAPRPPTIANLLAAYAPNAITAERRRLIMRLARDITAEPTRFTSVKAVLLTELRGVDGAPFSPDFFQLRSDKRLPAGEGGNFLVDEDRHIFHDALPSGADPAVLTFAEELDDARYGSAFRMQAFETGSFEGAIEAVRSKVGVDPFTDPVPIKDDVVVHPDGEVPRHTFTGPGQLQEGELRLASRLPVTAPAVIGCFSDPSKAFALEVGDRLDEAALKARREILTVRDSRLFVTAVSEVAQKPPGIDIVEAAFAYAVAGDEETGSASARFANDSFVLSFAPPVSRAAIAEANPRQEDARSWLLNAAAAPSAASVPQLERIFEPNIIQTLQQLAKPARMPAAAFGHTITVPQDNRLHVEQRPGDSRVRFAALLQSSVDQSDGSVRAGHILLVVAAFPLWEQGPHWERDVFRLTHQRNMIGALPVFSPHFGMANQAAPIDPGLLTSVIDIRDEPPQRLPRTLTARDLVTRLVGGNLPARIHDWRNFDVAITVSSRLDRRVLVARRGAEGKEMMSYSKIPGFVRRIGAAAVTPNAPFQLDDLLEWFPATEGVNDFICDFTWFSRGSNAVTLTVRNAHVTAF